MHNSSRNRKESRDLFFERKEEKTEGQRKSALRYVGGVFQLRADLEVFKLKGGGISLPRFCIFNRNFGTGGGKEKCMSTFFF